MQDELNPLIVFKAPGYIHPEVVFSSALFLAVTDMSWKKGKGTK